MYFMITMVDILWDSDWTDYYHLLHAVTELIKYGEGLCYVDGTQKNLTVSTDELRDKFF